MYSYLPAVCFSGPSALYFFTLFFLLLLLPLFTVMHISLSLSPPLSNFCLFYRVTLITLLPCMLLSSLPSVLSSHDQTLSCQCRAWPAAVSHSCWIPRMPDPKMPNIIISNSYRYITTDMEVMFIANLLFFLPTWPLIQLYVRFKVKQSLLTE